MECRACGSLHSTEVSLQLDFLLLILQGWRSVLMLIVRVLVMVPWLVISVIVVVTPSSSPVTITTTSPVPSSETSSSTPSSAGVALPSNVSLFITCLLYTSDAADD